MYKPIIIISPTQELISFFDISGFGHSAIDKTLLNSDSNLPFSITWPRQYTEANLNSFLFFFQESYIFLIDSIFKVGIGYVIPRYYSTPKYHQDAQIQIHLDVCQYYHLSVSKIYLVRYTAWMSLLYIYTIIGVFIKRFTTGYLA